MSYHHISQGNVPPFALLYNLSRFVPGSLQWAAWHHSPWSGESTSASVVLTLDWQRLRPLERRAPLLSLEQIVSNSSSSSQTRCEAQQKNVLLSSWPCPSVEQGQQHLSHVSRCQRWWCRCVCFYGASALFYLVLFTVLPPCFTNNALYCLFSHFSAVSSGPDFCCSSDSYPQGAPSGLDTRENGWLLIRCQAPSRANVFWTQTFR